MTHDLTLQKSLLNFYCQLNCIVLGVFADNLSLNNTTQNLYDFEDNLSSNNTLQSGSVFAANLLSGTQALLINMSLLLTQMASNL